MKWGGVALLISDKLKYKNRSDLETQIEGIYESSIVEIEGKHKKNIILCSLYRVPGSDIKQFKSEYVNLVMKAKTSERS